LLKKWNPFLQGKNNGKGFFRLVLEIRNVVFFRAGMIVRCGVWGIYEKSWD
jgi:hypothetical protein